MDDMYVTAGNQERGWNDPPQFSYGLQTARGPPRTLLNKRAAPPAGAGAPPPMYSSANPLAPTQCGLAPPPLHKAGPPPGCVAPPLPPSGPMMSQKEAGRSQSERVPDVEAVVLVLRRALAACRQAIAAGLVLTDILNPTEDLLTYVQGSVLSQQLVKILLKHRSRAVNVWWLMDQVCNDVDKRLRLLEDGWRSGQLSLPVQRRMDALSQELQSGHWDAADEIHRSLMVDHVTEVIQWMVGVKRLIAETRNLSPELLQLLHNPEEPVQEAVSQS